MPDDFKVKIGFFRHRKTLRVIAKYGTDGAFSILRLWSYATEFYPKGDLSSLDESEWRSATGRGKDCMQFVEDLFTPGMNFLDRDKKGRVLLHDWKEHQAWVFFSKERSITARKNIEKRWKGQKTKKKTDDTTSIPAVSILNTDGNTDRNTSFTSTLPLTHTLQEEKGKPTSPIIVLVSQQKAEAAWPAVKSIIETLSNDKLIIRDTLSRKLFFEFGGLDKIREAYRSDPDNFKNDFIAKYSRLEQEGYRQKAASS